MKTADSAADRALHAFLRGTKGRTETTVALRALTLHMLRGLAPAFFDRHALRPALEHALHVVRTLPATLDATVDPELAMARLDVLYLRALRNDPSLKPPPPRPLRAMLERADAQSPLYAWLLGRLAARVGTHTPFAERTLKQSCSSPIEELYFATHVLLLESDYCAKALKPSRHRAEKNVLLRGLPLVVEQRLLDIGAEVAFCLTMLGDPIAALHRWLRLHQREDGVVSDPGDGGFDALHTTAASLLAFAAAEDAVSAASSDRDIGVRTRGTR